MRKTNTVGAGRVIRSRVSGSSSTASTTAPVKPAIAKTPIVSRTKFPIAVAASSDTVEEDPAQESVIFPDSYIRPPTVAESQNRTIMNTGSRGGQRTTEFINPFIQTTPAKQQYAIPIKITGNKMTTWFNTLDQREEVEYGMINIKKTIVLSEAGNTGEMGEIMYFQVGLNKPEMELFLSVLKFLNYKVVKMEVLKTGQTYFEILHGLETFETVLDKLQENIYYKTYLELKYLKDMKYYDVKLEDNMMFSFKVKNCEGLDAALLLQIMLQYIDTMAVDCVVFEENTSIHTDEQLITTLEGITFDSNNVDLFSLSLGCNLECVDERPCYVGYNLSVSVGQEIRDVTTADLVAITETYNVLPVNFNVISIANPVPQPICKIFNNQELKFTIYLKKGNHHSHSKFQCITLLAFKPLKIPEQKNIYEFSGKLRGNLRLDNILKAVNNYLTQMTPVTHTLEMA